MIHERPAQAAHGARRPITVLFVCTHNSARSIMAESLLRQLGGGAFEAHSAGTQPGTVHALTLRVLEEARLPTAGLRSKAVEEFLGQSFDYVVTVCDSARQVCPAFPGEGERLHWGYEDPSAVTGDEEERLEAFRRVLTAISERINLFIRLARRAEPRRPAPVGPPRADS